MGNRLTHVSVEALTNALENHQGRVSKDWIAANAMVDILPDRVTDLGLLLLFPATIAIGVCLFYFRRELNMLAERFRSEDALLRRQMLRSSTADPPLRHPTATSEM